MGRAAKLFAIATLLATGQAVADDSQESLPDASKPRFALGLRGLVPPIFVIPEVTFKPGGPLAMNFSALYLPSGAAGLGSGAPRLTLATHLTAEFAKPAENGWYISAGAVYYHAFRDANGFHETVVLVPMTVGFLVRTPVLEAQVGTGVQFLSDDLSPCSGWCFGIKAPPILPALDLVFRHVF